MKGLVLRVAAVVVATSAVACHAFERDAPASPSAVPVARFANVTVQYRQPNGCENAPEACDNLVVFFGSWMKPGQEIYLDEQPGRVWTGVVTNVPVNWPPTDAPHLVRVFDPHLVDTPSGGVTAVRLAIGGQAIYFLDSAGTPKESGLIYVDDDGVGHNPY